MAVTRSANGNITLSISAAMSANPSTGTTLGFGPQSHSFSDSLTNAFTDGQGADQMERYWYVKGRELAGDASEIWNLADAGLAGSPYDGGFGAGNDVFGISYAVTAIVGVVLFNRSATAILEISANSQVLLMFNADLDRVEVGPGGMFCCTRPDTTGWVVTGTTDALVITETASATATYDLYIFSRTG